MVNDFLMGDSGAVNQANEIVERHQRRNIEATCRSVLELLNANGISIEVFLENVKGLDEALSTSQKLRNIRLERSSEGTLPNIEEVLGASGVDEEVEEVEDEQLESTGEAVIEPEAKGAVQFKTVRRTPQKVSGKIQEPKG